MTKFLKIVNRLLTAALAGLVIGIPVFAGAVTWNDAQFLPYVKSSATSYAIGANDYFIGLTSSSARTVTTDAGAQVAGRVLIIKDENGNAATNNVTFDPSGSITIDGATTKVINTNSGALRVYCDGTNWFSF